MACRKYQFVFYLGHLMVMLNHGGRGRGYISVSVLYEWVDEIHTIVIIKLINDKSKTIQPPYPVLHNHVKTCLEQLHDKYVFVSAYKVAINVIIICKQYPLKTFIFKHYYKRNSLSEFWWVLPYIWTNWSICLRNLASHLQYLDKFKLSFTVKYKILSRIYSIPKLHKNPYKF